MSIVARRNLGTEPGNRWVALACWTTPLPAARPFQTADHRGQHPYHVPSYVVSCRPSLY